MGKMRKEIIIGLTVISLLLVVFAAMLYKRLRAQPDDAPQSETVIAGQLPVPIRHQEPGHHEPRATLVAADMTADSEPPAAGWASRNHHEADLTSAQSDLPPRESYLPREEPAAEAAADSAFDAAADSSGILNPGAESAGDPFVRGRAAVQNLTDDMPAGSGDPTPADFDPRLRGGADRDELQAVEEQAGQQDLIRGQLAESQPVEAVPTSGELPADGESPRAGFRSRFPQQEEMRSEGYDAADRQPGHLRHESGEFSGAAQPPVTVENGKYTVAPNDNYWIISQKVYGDGGYFKAIYEHNRLRFPRADKLQVGDVLDVPHVSVLHERYAELCPKQRKVPSARNTLMSASTRHRVGERVYVVGEGDTLFDIAKYELGKATRWAEIYELNRDVLGEEFDYLRPGTELVLPHDRREGESVTRGREGGMQR